MTWQVNSLFIGEIALFRNALSRWKSIKKYPILLSLSFHDFSLFLNLEQDDGKADYFPHIADRAFT